jgi:curved DNA-binding protein
MFQPQSEPSTKREVKSMTESSYFEDYYETLQLNPNADFETVERVFRLLAKKYHPDNKTTGDVEKFRRLRDAYQVLSDPENRAAYDATYDERRSKRWQMFFDAAPKEDEPREDKWVQKGVLSLLYSARRRDAHNPGVGIYELKRFLSAPENHLEFLLWYLKEKGFIQRTEGGQYAITVDGVDEVSNENYIANNYLLPEGAVQMEAAQPL